jgi:hypothetical protein
VLLGGIVNQGDCTMPLSIRIQALYTTEIITEFQGYGLNVIAQEHRTGAYSFDAARKFNERYNLESADACIWTSESLFAYLINEELLAGHNMDWCLPAGWIYFRRISDVPAADIGSLMAARLRGGKAVTLTALTASYLNTTFKAAPPLYCARPLRMALWTLVRFVLWTKRPLMIELRHRHRAQLWHLRIKSVAAYFAARPRLDA